MQGSSQTMALALRQLTVVEGTLRRTLPQLHDLARAELLVSDLTGYANLREAWMHAYRAMQYCVDQKLGLNTMGELANETVPPVPEELFPYAIDAPVPTEVQYELAQVFPDFVRAMESPGRLMEEGPTSVSMRGGIDPDSIDVAGLIRDLDSRGYSDALDVEVDDAIFGHPLAKDVTQALRMAAAYDLYMELRLRSVPSEPRKFWRVPGPEWILLGLQLGTVAAQSATEVLRHQATKKKRMSVSELAELIRKGERV